MFWNDKEHTFLYIHNIIIYENHQEQHEEKKREPIKWTKNKHKFCDSLKQNSNDTHSNGANEENHECLSCACFVVFFFCFGPGIKWILYIFSPFSPD